MRLFILQVLIVFCTQFSFAQNQEYIDSILNKIPTLSDSAQIFAYTNIFMQYYQRDMEMSRKYVDEIIAAADRYGDPRYIPYSRNILAVHYSLESDYQKSLEIYEKVLDQYEALGDQERQSAVMNNMAGVYRNLGQLEKSLNMHMTSLNLKEELGVKPADLAASYWNIGNTLSEIKNWTESNNWYRKALEIYQELNDEDAIIGSKYLIALNLKQLDSLEFAMPVFKEVMEYDRANNKLNNLAGDLDNLGEIATELGKYDEAEEYLLEALDIALNNGEKRLPGFIYRRLSQLYLKTKEYAKAEKYALLSLENAEQTNESKKKITDYLVLSQIYDSLNMPQKALPYFQQYHTLYDSILGVEKLNAINELQVRYETEKKEQAIALLEEKVKVSKLRQYGIAGGAIGVLIIAGLFIYALRERLKKNQLAKEKLAQQLEFSQKELQARKKELTAFALQLANKNETLKNIRKNVEDVRVGDEGRKSIQSIVNSIDLDIHDDETWETFRQKFETVHKDFEANVTNKYQNLTVNDLRLMSLLKLNLSSKEIANILNISPEGIKKARYRLRKKMGLDSSESLEMTVMGL